MASESTVVVLGRSPEKMRAATTVLETHGFAVVGVFTEADALRAIAGHDSLLAVVAGGSVSAAARERLRAAAAAHEAVIVDTAIGRRPRGAFHVRGSAAPHRRPHGSRGRTLIATRGRSEPHEGCSLRRTATPSARAKRSTRGHLMRSPAQSRLPPIRRYVADPAAAAGPRSGIPVCAGGRGRGFTTIDLRCGAARVSCRRQGNHRRGHQRPRRDRSADPQGLPQRKMQPRVLRCQPVAAGALNVSKRRAFGLTCTRSRAWSRECRALASIPRLGNARPKSSSPGPKSVADRGRSLVD
jgi:hypothetical protein